MTQLRHDAPTKRETATTVQGRPILIEAGPRLLTLRLKGRRYRYSIPWESVWNRAAELEARRRMDERRAQREARRRARGKR